VEKHIVLDGGPTRRDGRRFDAAVGKLLFVLQDRAVSVRVTMAVSVLVIMHSCVSVREDSKVLDANTVSLFVSLLSVVSKVNRRKLYLIYFVLSAKLYSEANVTRSNLK